MIQPVQRFGLVPVSMSGGKREGGREKNEE